MENTSTKSDIFLGLVLAVGSLSAGYFLGLRAARKFTSLSRGLASAPTTTDTCKLALVVRTDLGMSTGKIAAQCSHATLACYEAMLGSNTRLLKRWEETGQTKVALRCAGQEELLTLRKRARDLNLCAESIRDAGRTQIAAGSMTVLGILGPTKVVDEVTGSLKLL